MLAPFVTAHGATVPGTKEFAVELTAMTGPEYAALNPQWHGIRIHRLRASNIDRLHAVSYLMFVGFGTTHTRTDASAHICVGYLAI
jgi:hypothetical protein